MSTMQIHINPTFENTDSYVLVEPTFNAFLLSLPRALAMGFTTIDIRDAAGQFATMPRWAMAQKIQELTGFTTAFDGNGLIYLYY